MPSAREGPPKPAQPTPSRVGGVHSILLPGGEERETSSARLAFPLRPWGRRGTGRGGGVVHRCYPVRSDTALEHVEGGCESVPLAPDHGAVERAGCTCQDCDMKSGFRQGLARQSLTVAPMGQSASGPTHPTCRATESRLSHLFPVNPGESRDKLAACPIPADLIDAHRRWPPAAHGVALTHEPASMRPAARALPPAAPSDGDTP